MSKIKTTDFLNDLKIYRPCSDAWQWAQQFESWQELWDKCDRGDWMLWIIGRTAREADRKRIVSVACECARLALPYTKDPRVLKCIETVEAWVRGEATIAEVRQARKNAAAYAADDAADAAAAAYAAAAYAAAAYAADAYAAAYAAAAYAAAAYAADAAAADAAARRSSLKRSADIVRKYYPTAPNLVKTEE